MLVGLTLAAGAFRPGWLALTASREARPPRRLSGPAIAAVVAGLIVVVGVAAVVEHRQAGRFVERQWHEFLRTGDQNPTSQRLGSTRGPRSDFCRVALDAFAAQPVRGIGSGGFGPRYFRERRTQESARDVHSQYLEILSELGIVGGLILLAFVAATVVAVVAARRRPGPLGSGAAAAVGAARVT